MNLFILIIGAVMIISGFLVKSYPNLIAGYNTLPEYQKKNVDIKGLSTFMRNGFILIGLVIIIGHYLFKWMGFTVFADVIPIAAILIGLIIMVVYAQRYDHNKNKSKRTKLTYIALGLVMVFIFGDLIYSSSTSEAIFSKDTVTFTGKYGFEMHASNIADVVLTDNIPNIKMKTNGFSLGQVKKGFFNLDGLGNSRLLLHSNTPPFLILSKNDGEKIILNFKDKLETEMTYDKIKAMVDK